MEDLIFISAQPDVPYFHWQSRVYIHNFISKGIKPNQIHIIFGLMNKQTEPSYESLELKKLGVNIHYYKDERKFRYYIPSIKPFLISKWLKENPNFGKLFFLHDADIIFRNLPDFNKLINDDITYLSDTISYIGYNYIIDCCNRYENKYPNSPKQGLLDDMCDVVGIGKEIIKSNQNNSGGGQYLIKNSNYEIWEKIYLNSTQLYDKMWEYHKKYPLSPGEIQFWTAEMWSLLWNLWINNQETRISNELDFSWATDNIEVYRQKNILHMAGVTDNLKTTKFYKGDFININPLNKLKDDIHFFDYVEKTSSTIEYIKIMKEIVENDF